MTGCSELGVSGTESLLRQAERQRPRVKWQSRFQAAWIWCSRENATFSPCPSYWGSGAEGVHFHGASSPTQQSRTWHLLSHLLWVRRMGGRSEMHTRNNATEKELSNGFEHVQPWDTIKDLPRKPGAEELPGTLYCPSLLSVFSECRSKISVWKRVL